MPMYPRSATKPVPSATSVPVSAPALRAHRLRPSGVKSRGGASSLLRLSHAGEGSLPSGTALTGWAQRAAAAALSAHGHGGAVLTRFWPGNEPAISLASES